jgi:hypothetical protein
MGSLQLLALQLIASRAAAGGTELQQRVRVLSVPGKLYFSDVHCKNVSLIKILQNTLIKQQ